MSKKRLSLKEIADIEREAVNNPDYTLENEIRFGKNKTSILRVSPKSGLILIHGDKKTGYEHIIKRHSEPGSLEDWMKNADNPPHVFSIKKFADMDFINISDEIFSTGNLNAADNKNNKLYDLYTGTCAYFGKPISYNLMLHKNSKIIHNLFPTENNYNKYPENFKLYRKLVKGECDYSSGNFVYEINYFDREGKNLYRLILNLNLEQFLTVKYVSSIDGMSMDINPLPIKLNLNMHAGAHLIPTFLNGNLGDYELLLKQYHDNL